MTPALEHDAQSMDETLSGALEERRRQALYRRRITTEKASASRLCYEGREFLAFCSNDYLGLADHPELVDALRESALREGVGSRASHLVSGHHSEHEALERELAEFLGRERALLFSTGYMANLGVVSALVGRRDRVMQDKLNHASLIDGARLSGATFQRFRHADMEDLDRRLQSGHYNRNLIAIDGVFSMDGDLAPLDLMAEAARQHKAWLMVDDAHGIGCIGPEGRGSVAHFGLGPSEVPVLMGTLGKAFGCFGAFVAGSETLVETLIQFARPYVYTTALPPSLASAARKALSLLQRADDRRRHLAALIECFRSQCGEAGIPLLPSSTPIQPVLTGDASKALRLSEGLAARGIWVTAIRPPTVPAGSSRLRVALSAAHSVKEMHTLCTALKELWDD